MLRQLVLASALASSVSVSAQENTEVTPAITDQTPSPIDPPNPQPYVRSEMDWVNENQVPDELRDARCENCKGRYIDPLAGADEGVSIDESDVNATATSTELLGDTVLLTGGVLVTQGYRQLQGDSATINRATGSGTLEGNITIREPGLLLRGNKADYTSETGEASVEGSEYVLHEQHLHGRADALERDAAGLIHIANGSMSYCPPEDEQWMMRADDIELNLEEGEGTARGAKFDIAGVPVLYAPWVRFPLDDRRKSGFLWPDIGSDTRGGLDVAVPIYYNAAENYDLLYTPRYIQERGINHEAYARYLGPLIGQWNFAGAFLSDDDGLKDDIPDLDNYDRWLTGVYHNGLFSQRWRTRVDYTKVSDVDYLKDLDSSSLESKRQTSLLQLGSVDYLGDKWLVGLDVQQFQSLADDIRDDYQKLPQITASYRSDKTPFEISPIAQLQYSNFDADIPSRVTGQRVYGELGVTYPMEWEYGFLRPTTKYRQLAYSLDESTVFTEDTPTAGVAVAAIDSGLFFERSTSFAGERLLQTLEPRLFYLYSEYEEQKDQPDFDTAELTFSYNQLFRQTRFSGRDRLDDANQASIGITTRFINEEDGQEQFSASLGQIVYFDDRKVRLRPSSAPLDDSKSEIAGELDFYPNERLSLRSNLQWEIDTGKVNAGNLNVSYQQDNGGVHNLGYSYRRPQTITASRDITEQATVSTYLPMGRQWSFFASMSYSVEAERSVEDMFGLEYDTCCWMVRLLHLRYYDTVPGQSIDFDNPDLEREHSTQFQIVLKGMGGYGNRVGGLMEDMIRGYEDREY
ncbi:MAG: LPS-assembly protein LptD [Halioglobus sp.]